LLILHGFWETLISLLWNTTSECDRSLYFNQRGPYCTPKSNCQAFHFSERLNLWIHAAPNWSSYIRL